MSPGEQCLDTNVLVYAFSDDPRAAPAQNLLDLGCVTALQCLNEFANVARRKLGLDWPEIVIGLADIRSLCSSVLPLDIATHEHALELAGRYNLSIYDALLVSAALRGGCRLLWSEDMQDGLLVDEQLRVTNPFKR